MAREIAAMTISSRLSDWPFLEATNSAIFLSNGDVFMPPIYRGRTCLSIGKKIYFKDAGSHIKIVKKRIIF